MAVCPLLRVICLEDGFQLGICKPTTELSRLLKKSSPFFIGNSSELRWHAWTLSLVDLSVGDVTLIASEPAFLLAHQTRFFQLAGLKAIGARDNSVIKL